MSSHRTSLSDATHDTLHSTTKEQAQSSDAPTSKLDRTIVPLFAVAVYAGLTVAAWVITCILVHRPITGGLKHYNVDVLDFSSIYGWAGATYMADLYEKNEEWYRTARVMRSIASVLTIPLTCAVCSSAAVVFIQRPKAGLTVRKVMALADGGWTSPQTHMRLFLTRRGWSRFGSSLLFIAIILIFLGGVITPLQELFLSSKTIKAPTFPQMVFDLVDIPDMFQQDSLPELDPNLITLMTRSALSSSRNDQPQAMMWQGAGFTCNLLQLSTMGPNGEGLATPEACVAGSTFGNMSTLQDPFLAQLTNGYSTGVISQFIPRFNSSATYENITGDANAWPVNCDTIPGSFWAEYGDGENWSVQVCMPANMIKSPWKNTRNRQDFSEQLFLNITINENAVDPESEPTPPTGEQFRLTMNTTAGYFELPNYMNGNVAGPLLEEDPNTICGLECLGEGFNETNWNGGI